MADERTSAGVSDGELLGRYAREGDQGAFGVVVGRHVDWVYSAALRMVGEAGLAEDVTQGVFAAMGQKAGRLAEHPTVTGWLFTATQFGAMTMMKRERRRKVVEGRAAAERGEGVAEVDRYWGEIRGKLEEAVGRLRGEDREAILLRYYRQMSLGEVGAALGIGEEAARKRVARAVEKLRGRLGGSEAMLSGALVAHGVVKAPAHLMAAAGGVKGMGSAAIAKGIKAMMMMTKLKIAAVVVGAVMVPVAVVVVAENGRSGGGATTEPAVAASEQAGSGVAWDEVTGVKGHLRGDGTVDFLAMVNEKYGKGVTAENNGFVVWLKVMGADAIKAEGRAEIVTLSGSTDAPAAGWVDWSARPGVSAAEGQKLEAEMVYVTRHVWKGAEHPEYAEYLKEREGLMGLATEASEKERWWSPATGKGGAMMNVLLPALKPMRDVARALCARALLRAGTGDFEGFLADVMTVKRLVRKETGWTLIDELVKYNVENLVNRAIGAAAGSGIFSAEECARLGKALDGIGPLQEEWEMVDTGERWGQLDLMQLIAVGKVEELMGDDAPTNAWLRTFEAVDVEAVDWGAAARKANAETDELVGILKGERTKEKSAALRAFNRRVNRADHKGGLLKDAEETREAYTERVGARIIAAYLGGNGASSGTVIEQDGETEMLREMARAVVAAGEYRAEKGKWPEALKELVPGYLKGVPVDVHAGGEGVRYEVKGNGVWLHSAKEELGVGVGE